MLDQGVCVAYKHKNRQVFECAEDQTGKKEVEWLQQVIVFNLSLAKQYNEQDKSDYRKHQAKGVNA